MSKNTDAKASFAWPLRIRLVHWLLALVVVADALILLDGDEIHQYLGYLGVALVLFRFYLGVKGVEHARFKSFPVSLSHLENFAKNYLKKGHVYPGHNPLASIVYFLMWACVLFLGLSGWMMGLDAFWGSSEIGSIHSALSNTLLLLVALHLVGVLMDSFIHKRKTWLKMINGK